MLTSREKWEIGGGFLTLLIVAILGGSWLGAREDSIRMKATIDAQQQVIAASAKQARDLLDAEAERDKMTAANVAALAAAAAKQVTPGEIASWLPKQLAGPQPITFTIPTPTAANPAPNAMASIPQSDLPALRDQIEKCQECGLKLTAAEADVASRDERLALAGAELSAMSKERDAAVKASKGGSFWTRTKRAAKWLVIGIGVGAAAVCGSGHCK
jgi:hypothetical protein